MTRKTRTLPRRKQESYGRRRPAMAFRLVCVLLISLRLGGVIQGGSLLRLLTEQQHKIFLDMSSQNRAFATTAANRTEHIISSSSTQAIIMKNNTQRIEGEESPSQPNLKRKNSTEQVAKERCLQLIKKTQLQAPEKRDQKWTKSNWGKATEQQMKLWNALDCVKVLGLYDVHVYSYGDKLPSTVYDSVLT